VPSRPHLSRPEGPHAQAVLQSLRSLSHLRLDSCRGHHRRPDDSHLRKTSVNENGEVVGKGDIRAQTEQPFRNLQIALASAGATFRDVVKLSFFVVGLKPEYVPVIREIRSRYLAADQPPATTLVGVSALVGVDWLIEIEATAVVGE